MVDNPAFGRSIGGDLGARPVTTNSIGLGAGPATSLIPPTPQVWWGDEARNVPNPNAGSTSQRGATAARFPAVQGRPTAGELGDARRRAPTSARSAGRGQW